MSVVISTCYLTPVHACCVQYFDCSWFSCTRRAVVEVTGARASVTTLLT